MAIYGRSGSDADIGVVASGNARVAVLDPMPSHGWGWRMGGRLARWHLSSGSATVRFIAYDTVGTGGSPDDLVGRTAEFTVSNAGSFAGDASQYVQNINSAPGSPSNSAIMMYSGRTYAVGYIVQGATLMHQMAAAANVSYNNESFYHKSGLGSTSAPNPYSASSTTNEGMLNAYIEYEVNEAPNTPTGLSPTGTISSTTPTFAATFSDDNTDRGDSLDQIDIQLRQVGTTSLKWNSTYDATASEASNGAMSRAYAGSALSPATSYEWRVRFADRFGAWGPYTNWTTFVVNSGGSIGQGTTPIGKVETNTPGPFQAVYNHASSLSTNAVEIRLLSGTTVVRAAFQKAAVIANGGTVSFTWAETGWAALEWGKSYAYEMRARDSANVWSDWSANRTISTNAYPSVPSILRPTTNTIVTAYPLLSFIFSDVDDTTVTGLTAEIRIKTNAGALIATRTATFDATLNKWTYQVTAADFATFATYKWDARSYDGTLYSAYTAEQTIIYANGPVITNVQLNGVAANGATITTHVPTVTWAVSGSTQQSFRVRVYASPYDPDAAPIYDSGTIVSAVGSHTILSGYLHNNIQYALIVTVTNTVPVTGSTPDLVFTVAFPAPTSITGFQASPIAVAGDIQGQTSAVLLGWNALNIPPNTFVENYLVRTPQGASDEPVVILARLPAIDQNTYIDYFPASGVSYSYAIYKVVYQGTDITEAAPALATATVSFDHAIISSAIDPTARRVVLRVNRSTSIDQRGEAALLFPWGESEPYIMESLVDYAVVQGSYMLYTTNYQNAEVGIQTLKAMRKSHEVICYRDERGEKAFGHLLFKVDYSEMRRYILTITLTESNFREGISPDGIS